MKHIARIFSACCLVLFPTCPALADLEVTFINRTDFELLSVHMTGDGATLSSGLRVVPGNFCTITDGTSSTLQAVTLDAGMMRFAFTDMAAVAGMSNPNF